MAGFSTTSGGLNFQYPNRDTENWDAVMANTFTTISSHDHSRDTAGRGNALTDRSILANNAGWLQSKDLAGTGTINLIRGTTSDKVELGGNLASLTVDGLATIGTTLGVTGATTLSSTLQVAGTTTLSAATDIQDTLTVSGATDLNSTLEVAGATTLSSSLTVVGASVLGPLTYPSADGSNGQSIITNGAGTLSFQEKGKFIQNITATSSATFSTTTVMPTDGTIPQNTEGGELITASITPKNTSNKLVIDVIIPWITCSVAANIGVALFQDSTADALASQIIWNDASDKGGSTTLRYEMTAGTVSSTTFKVRVGASNAGTTYVARAAGGSNLHGGKLIYRINIKEILV